MPPQVEPIGNRGLEDPRVLDDCLERIARLEPDAAPVWGRMSSAQMLAHCAEVQEVMNGASLEGTPWYLRLAGPLIRRGVLGTRPYARNLRTHPQYVQTSAREFEAEKRRLLEALTAYRESASKPVKHPLFGQLTAAEKGWGAYKHLDHHLTQFGV